MRKTRKIYFTDNVKLHFDEVEGLGSYSDMLSLREVTWSDDTFLILLQMSEEQEALYKTGNLHIRKSTERKCT